MSSPKPSPAVLAAMGCAVAATTLREEAAALRARIGRDGCRSEIAQRIARAQADDRTARAEALEWQARDAEAAEGLPPGAIVMPWR